MLSLFRWLYTVTIWLITLFKCSATFKKKNTVTLHSDYYSTHHCHGMSHRIYGQAEIPTNIAIPIAFPQYTIVILRSDFFTALRSSSLSHHKFMAQRQPKIPTHITISICACVYLQLQRQIAWIALITLTTPTSCHVSLTLSLSLSFCLCL